MKKLKMPLERFEYLEDLRESLDLRLNLWTSLRDWKVLTNGWINSKFEEIDVNAIQTKGEKYLKICKKCIHGLAKNEPLDELIRQVSEFTKATPVVVALRKLQNVQENRIHYLIQVSKIVEPGAKEPKITR